MTEPDHQIIDFLDWRVTLKPLDDFEEHVMQSGRPAEIIEDCVKEFRKKLYYELAMGRLVSGYGPLT